MKKKQNKKAKKHCRGPSCKSKASKVRKIIKFLKSRKGKKKAGNTTRKKKL